MVSGTGHKHKQYREGHALHTADIIPCVIITLCVLLYILVPFCFYHNEPLNYDIDQSSLSVVFAKTRPFLRNEHGDTVGMAIQRHLPHCIIIGAKKAGTRALLTFLDLHPDIVTSFSEVHFFDKHYDQGLAYYKSKMPPSSGSQITIEKTANYFVVPGIPERIERMNSSTRLLLVVRNPVDGLISRYTHWGSHREDTPSLEHLLCDENGHLNASFRWLHYSDYHKHLSRWLKHFSMEQIHVVSGERLTTEPYNELNTVEDFLSLRRYISRDMFYFNETKGFYCYMAEGGAKMCLGERKGRTHPIVKPGLMEELKNYYAPKNDLFFRLINKRFDW